MHTVSASAGWVAGFQVSLDTLRPGLPRFASTFPEMVIDTSARVDAYLST